MTGQTLTEDALLVVKLKAQKALEKIEVPFVLKQMIQGVGEATGVVAQGKTITVDIEPNSLAVVEDSLDYAVTYTQYNFGQVEIALDTVTYATVTEKTVATKFTEKDPSILRFASLSLIHI